MPTLYDLDVRDIALIAEIEAHLEESGGEDTPELQELIDKRLEWEYKVNEKFDAYGYIMDEINAEADALDAKIKALQKRQDELRAHRNVLQNQVGRMKERLRVFLAKRGIQRVIGEFRFRRQRTNPALIIDESEIPTKFADTPWVSKTISWDKTEIRNALKAGTELPFKAELQEQEALIQY